MKTLKVLRKTPHKVRSFIKALFALVFCGFFYFASLPIGQLFKNKN